MAIDSFQRLPTGAGRREVPKEEKVPVVDIANEVIYVNPSFQSSNNIASLRLLPFRIAEGESTNLGIFAGQLDSETTSANEQRTAEGGRKHHRSLVLAQVLFKDAEGRLYRDVDAKGIGNVQERSGELKAYPIEKGEPSQGMLGIFERSVAEKDASLAEEFISLGIRTYRVIAITKLKELVWGDGKYSIEEAKISGIIPTESEPVISIRAFGTRDRIVDISSISEPPGNFNRRIDDARLMVAQELGRNPKEFGRKEYFHWFVETLAENVARMHRAHLIHGYLSEHNITLDCRIVDLDSVRPGSEIPVSDIREYLQTFYDRDDEKDPYKLDVSRTLDSIRRLELVFIWSGTSDIDADKWGADFRIKYLQILEEKSSKAEK